MAIKELKTKIALKYLDFNTWSAESFKSEKPLKGEVWFCEIPSGNAAATTAPTVLFKVGDGVNTFGALKWGSALAADVYEWAKQNGVKIEGAGNAVTNAVIKTAADGKQYLTFEKGTTFATKAELDAAIEAFGGDLSAITDNDHQYSFVITDGKLVVTAVNYVNGKAGESTTVATLDFVTPNELADTLNNYYTKNDLSGKIHTKEEIKAIKVANADHADAAAKVDTALTVKVGGADVVFDGSEAKTADVDTAIAAAEQRAKAYADAKPHENTAHTHSNGTGTKVTAAGGINGDVKVNLNVALELDNKTIKLYDKDDTTKTAIATLDATEFIADGMLSKVEADETNNKLVFTWNTDAGISTTEIPFDKIADIYTGGANSEISVAVSNTNEITATLVNKGITEEKLEQDVQDALALARTALQSHQDLSNYKTKQTAVTDKGLTGAKVLSSLSQNENGEISYQTRTITGEDVGLPAINTLVNCSFMGFNKPVFEIRKDTEDATGFGADKYVIDFHINDSLVVSEVDATGYTPLCVNDNYIKEIEINKAVKATKDAKGNVIDETYAKDAALHAVAKSGDFTDLINIPAHIGSDTIEVYHDFMTDDNDRTHDEYQFSVKEGSISKAHLTEELQAEMDTHLTEITTTANGGLKVTGKNKIDIDDEIIFVLNANF